MLLSFVCVLFACSVLVRAGFCVTWLVFVYLMYGVWWQNKHVKFFTFKFQAVAEKTAKNSGVLLFCCTLYMHGYNEHLVFSSYWRCRFGVSKHSCKYIYCKALKPLNPELPQHVVPRPGAPRLFLTVFSKFPSRYFSLLGINERPACQYFGLTWICNGRQSRFFGLTGWEG